MVVYLGAAQDPDPAHNPLWLQLRKFFKSHPEISGRYTIKMMAGFLDSQPALWQKHGTPRSPVEINALYGFWSWVDRLNPFCKGPLCPYFPTFNKVGARVENFTVSLATAGQDGWGCPDPNGPRYCVDDALRFGDDGRYATFESFMAEARKLDPIFLFLHQFNEFGPPDEGFDAKTYDAIEPTDLWGARALEVVQHQIRLYRRANRFVGRRRNAGLERPTVCDLHAAQDFWVVPIGNKVATQRRIMIRDLISAFGK
jgi:hypothetical protein